ncbi:MAG TPA: DUF4760 domain-containing protein [Candidatus Elarobacter sp.]|jgi:hypothetical protein|nr:DUF4760 domain-containing protein [Candidatus Elarobacter sp.]
MRVDAAALGLIFSGISALVVVVGGIAALRQVAHLRRANELAAIGKFVEEWSSEEFSADRMVVRTELAEMLPEPQFFEVFRTDPRAHRIFRVANFFERLAFFVRRGAVSEDLAMELFAAAAILHWEMMREFVVRLRVHYKTQTPMEWFEDFAMRAPEWSAKNDRRAKRLRRDPKAPFRAQETPAPRPGAVPDEGLPVPEP